MEDDHEDSRFQRKQRARRAAIDHGAVRGDLAAALDRGPTIGKHTLSEGVAAGYTAADAIAFLERSLGEARAALAALPRAVASGDKVAAVTAASSLRRSLRTARDHLGNGPAPGLAERRAQLADLEVRAARALGDAYDAGFAPASWVPAEPGIRSIDATLEAPGADPMQRKAQPAGMDEAGPPPPAGGGAVLPPDVRARMEAALGGDFAAVRVHEHAYAQAIGALAFTRGTEIFFAPGRFDPSSPQGLELLGHELAHVMQQAQGRVPVNAQVGGAPANDDPALEREADDLGAKAARGEAAPGGVRRQAASIPTAPANSPAQAKAASEASGNAPPDALPRLEELAGPEWSTPGRSGAAPIQKALDGKKTGKEYVAFKIAVARPMTGEEFKAAANLQMFGTAVPGSVWHNVKASYTPGDSPVEVLFEVALVQRMRRAATAAKGIDTDATGKVDGADVRTKDFHSRPTSGEKTAILAEINRRYHAATGTAPGSEIKPGESGKAALWRSFRDEVLFQHEYLASLPDKVKALIQRSIRGRDLRPADYDQLFRIAKKIEALPPGAAVDYASKITGTTTDLAAFEAAIDGYRGELAARERADAERTTVQNKLLGLEELYKLYRDYVSKSVVEAGSPLVKSATELAKKLGARAETAEDMRVRLEQQLRRHGFVSIAEFASYISRFEQAFRDGAARIVFDLLAKYAGKLYRESERYQDPAIVRELHGKLGGFRAQHQEFDRNARIWNDYATQHNRAVKQTWLPGHGGIHPKPPTPEQAQAGERASAAKAGADASIRSLSKEYPIFAEDELPVDKRLDKAKLAQASEAELGRVLQGHIADRNRVVAEVRTQVEGKHELVYKMDKLMPAFYAQLGIRPGSIHDQIIKDRIRDDAIAKLVGGIALAIVAIALTVVSLGSATPAVVAAGASIGAAGINAYMAYEEYKEYTAEHAIADAGFADDPSVAWLVLAIAGAGVDMAAVARSVRALAPAAKALDGGGEMADFTKAVEALQKSKHLDERIAAAAAGAAAARKSYAVAKGELSAALGKAYSLPGPFTDPDVYLALVKMAAAKIREGGHSLAAFIDELRQARLDRKVGELTPEELAKVKQAWAQAEEKWAKEAAAEQNGVGRTSVGVDQLDAAGKPVGPVKIVEKLETRITDAAQLQRLRVLASDAEIARLYDKVGEAARLEKLLKETGGVAKLEALLGKVVKPADLEPLLESFPVAELESIMAATKHPQHLAVMLEHMDTGSAVKMLRQWIAKSQLTNMDQFLERMSQGMGKQLAETAPVGANAIILDSNTAIALMKDADPALRSTMNRGEIARVAEIKVLPAGTELRIGNVTVGETGKTLSFKGVPLDGVRDSTEYQKLLAKLESASVGKADGFADRALVADAFFAKSTGGTPRLMTGDQDVVKKLARIAGIDVQRAGGYPGLLARYGNAGTVSRGFTMTVEGKSLTIIPVL